MTKIYELMDEAKKDKLEKLENWLDEQFEKPEIQERLKELEANSFFYTSVCDKIFTSKPNPTETPFINKNLIAKKVNVEQLAQVIGTGQT